MDTCFVKAAEIGTLLDSLCIYRNLLKDPVVGSFRRLVGAALAVCEGEPAGSGFADLYGTFINELAQRNCNLNFYQYMAEMVILDENPFTAAAGFDCPLDIPESLMSAARADLYALQKAADLDPAVLKSCAAKSQGCPEYMAALILRLPEWQSGPARQHVPAGSRMQYGEAQVIAAAQETVRKLAGSDLWEDKTDILAKFHHENGCGLFTLYPAFTWHNENGSAGIVPVEVHDPVRLTDLIAYESEREEVIRNTLQFIGGGPANNVLLYGDRGTGKSSTVKAILNEYCDKGLRMIEVPRTLLLDFPGIIRRLAGRNQKFIIFVDDLSFEDSEESYTSLKAALEGSLEVRPDNVVIYATSNRRHLVREKFSDRHSLQYGSGEDEIRASDTMQEKLSLSDRFGITVIFSSPDKERYLTIVDELVKRKGIVLDRETLHREAMKWELWYNGRSPRTACQFVSWLEGRV